MARDRGNARLIEAREVIAYRAAAYRRYFPLSRRAMEATICISVSW